MKRNPLSRQLALISLVVVLSMLTWSRLDQMEIAQATVNASSITLAGDLQDEITGGVCSDWSPDCAETHLVDQGNGVWRRPFFIPTAANYEYKMVVDNDWGNGSYPADNVSITVGAPLTVTFYLDEKTGGVLDTVNHPQIPVAAGSFQSELGCAGDWDPACVRSLLTDPDNDGIYTFSDSTLPAGDYEFKIAFNEAWGGDIPGSNVLFTIADEGDTVTISWNSANDDVTVEVTSSTPATGPASVTVVGNLQEAISDCDNWTPDCGETHMLKIGNGVWRSEFQIPAGPWEWKAALNDSWDESYPTANITFTLATTETVRFYFDYKTKQALDSINGEIATVAGSFQSELGCPGDWEPSCVITLMTDLDNDGVYTFRTYDIPAGSYTFKVTKDEDWAESYPVDDVALNLAEDDMLVEIGWDSGTNDVTLLVSGGATDLAAPAVSHAIQDEIFYFVLPDRFDNGDPTNDEGAAPGGTLAETGFLASDKAFYHGGDVAGMEARLDYLEEMGVTALWLTPLFENRPTQPDSSTAYGIGGAYHGYWIQDFETIDPHLGSEQAVIDFIAEAHSRDIKVFFDIVANHTADYIAYAEGTSAYRNKDDYPYLDADGIPFDDKDYAGTGTFPELDAAVSFPYTPTFDDPGHETIKNPAWLNDPIYYHNRGDSTFSGESAEYGDFFGLDDLFTEHPNVVLGMIDIFTNTIQTYNIDGFRIDTVKHVNIEFWQELAPAVMDFAVTQGKPDFYMFGEVFDGNPAVMSLYTTAGQLPSVLDFGMQGTARSFATSGLATDNVRDFFANDDFFTDADSNAYQLGNFISNHDNGRIGHVILNNNGAESDADHVKRSQLAHGLIFFARGFPIVYYGDEQGFTGGGGDKDARQDMFPSLVTEYDDYSLIGTSATYADDNFDQAHPLYQTIITYTNILSDHLALRQGAQIHRYSQDAGGVYAFSRIDRIERVEYIVALNNRTTAALATFDTWTPNTQFTALYPGGATAVNSNGSGSVNLNVPALSLVIYRADAAMPASGDAPGAPTFNTLVANAEVSGGRLEVGVDLAEARFAEVTFAARLGDGDYELIGTDNNAPYRVFYDISDVAPGTAVTFKAIVDDLNYGAASYGIATVTVYVAEDDAPPGEDPLYAIIHYHRPDGDYGDFTSSDFNDFWGLHLWGDGLDPDELPTWNDPRRFSAVDDYGAYVAIRIDDPTQPVGFIVHRGDIKDPDGDRFFIPADTPEIWLVSGDFAYYPSRAEAMGETLVHYNRDDEEYTDWGLHLWQNGDPPLTNWPDREMASSFDDFGAVYSMTTGAYPTLDVTSGLNLIVHNGAGSQEPDRSYTPADNYEIWVNSADDGWYAQEGAATGTATIHYRRCLGDYGDYNSSDYNDFWGLHTWGGASDPGWTTPRKADGQDAFGVYFEVPLFTAATELNYILHRGDLKDVPADQNLDLTTTGYEIWVVEGDGGANLLSAEKQFTHPAVAFNVAGQVCAGATIGNIERQRAYWLSENIIGWSPVVPADAVYLHVAPSGGLLLDASGISGGSVYTLTQNGVISGAIAAKFPHLSGLPAWELDPNDLAAVPDLLKGQIAVSAFNSEEVLIDATGLQIPGVLDDLYAANAYGQELGVVWQGAIPNLNLWAPTAKAVTLHLFDDAAPATTAITYTMSLDAGSGIWSVTGAADWNGKYYLYEVEVYVHSSGQVEHNLVTDPYAVSLAMNSTRSQIVSLSDETLQPAGWDSLVKPPLAAPEDISIYELHVRDFSAFDETVPEAERGTFRAFVYTDTLGMNHIASLVDAGLTHLHLLPVFDIATINENKAEWLAPDYDLLATYPPTSTLQQAAITAIADQDAFNWGYDPFHYNVPEGSYSTDPDGVARIVEFREMVQALNNQGLRVVVDVVYNHTNASGQHEKSVLDRIVPGYYHRLNATGQVETSTCCANTATEHDMMEKLMVDSVVLWATQYKVDAFRFDLMGHHMVANMVAVREALDALTLADHGVDGAAIYVYGEGWNFGEVADNARGVNATQLNMAGTGIGTFSDRLRDAVRGGGPFDNGEQLKRQGFANGLYYDPNDLPQNDPLATLLLLTDQIRVGMAGNLAGYEFIDRYGNLVTGADVDYNGQPAGYTADPQELISYISKHDNQTLFDINVYGAPAATSMEDRVRIQTVGLSTVIFGQGVPFFHAGSDLLRSKSLDRDSYNSGDWFNRLDFTYQSNNFGVGLPVAEKNQENWPIMEPFLADPALLPASYHITMTQALFEEMLQIRYSSPLFRLETAAAVQERVHFYNTGPSQLPGLIVAGLSDLVGDELDPNHQLIVVLINANDEAQTFTTPELLGLDLTLHPVQQNSVDPIVQTAAFDAATGSFTVPGRTTAVFVLETEPGIDPPVAGFTSNSPVALGETAVFTNTTSGEEPISYEWNFGDGSPVVSDEHPIHSYAITGTFTVVLTATNAGGSDAYSQLFVVTESGDEIDPPVAGFTSNSPVELGETAAFTNTTSGQDLVSYEWNFGDGSPLVTVMDPTHSYAMTGTFTVVLTATNAGGVDVYSQSFVVTEPENEENILFLPLIARPGIPTSAVANRVTMAGVNLLQHRPNFY